MQDRIPGLARSSATFFLASIIIFSARFLTSIIIARSLGPDGKGIYFLVLSTAAIFSLVVNLGLNGAVTYFTASKQWTSAQLSGFILLAVTILSAIGIILFIMIYQGILSTTFLKDVDPRYIFLILALLPFNLFGSLLMSIQLGEQRILTYNLIEISRAITILAFQILSFLIKAGIDGAIVAWVSANMLIFVGILIISRNKIHLPNKRSLEVTRPALAYGIKGYFANLFTFFNYRLDSYLVNLYLNPSAVGLYSTSVSTAELIWYIPNAVSNALFPKVAGLDPKAASSVTARACRVTLLLTFSLAVLLGVIGIWAIPFFYGDAFKPSIPPFLWLLPGILGITLSKVLSADLSGRGLPQYTTWSALLTLIVTIALNIWLIPALGISGAAIASVIAYWTSAILLIYLFHRVTRASILSILVPQRDDLTLLQGKTARLSESIRSWLKVKFS